MSIKINSSFYKDFFFPFILLSILAIPNLGLLIFVCSFYVHLCIFHQTAKIYSALFNDTYSNNFYLLIDCQVDLYWLIPSYTKKLSVWWLEFFVKMCNIWTKIEVIWKYAPIKNEYITANQSSFIKKTSKKSKRKSQCNEKKKLKKSL